MSLTRTLIDWPSESGLGPLPTIKLIGAKAHRYLSAPGFSGEVISAGTSAAYIATDAGDILAACRMDQQPHPRSFLTDLDLSMLHVGLRAWVEGPELRFSNGIALNMRNHQVWTRRSPEAEGALPMQELRSRCHALLQAAITLRDGENLGLSLPFFTKDDDSETALSLPITASPLIAAGIDQIRRLLPFCRCGNLRSALESSEHLIGLGPGLTPSGDDFVGGLIFMSSNLNTTYPEARWWEGGDIPALMARSNLMTSKISHALLTDLSEGQSHASLHDLADALLLDDKEFDAEDHVRRVTEIGHSSGWDMLAGMLAGLLPVVYRA